MPRVGPSYPVARRGGGDPFGGTTPLDRSGVKHDTDDDHYWWYCYYCFDYCCSSCRACGGRNAADGQRRHSSARSWMHENRVEGSCLTSKRPAMQHHHGWQAENVGGPPRRRRRRSFGPQGSRSGGMWRTHHHHRPPPPPPWSTGGSLVEVDRKSAYEEMAANDARHSCTVLPSSMSVEQDASEGTCRAKDDGRRKRKHVAVLPNFGSHSADRFPCGSHS